MLMWSLLADAIPCRAVRVFRFICIGVNILCGMMSDSCDASQYDYAEEVHAGIGQVWASQGKELCHDQEVLPGDVAHIRFEL